MEATADLLVPLLPRRPLLINVHRTLIVLFLKLYVGAFRPNFFDVCQPNRTLLHEEVIRHMENHTAMFFNATVCTGEMKLVKNAYANILSDSLHCC
jgi:hypothetical protein